MEKIKIAKLDEYATLPTRKHPTDAGIDLYSNNLDFFMGPFEIQVVQTGMVIEIPEGYVGLVLPKSRSNYLIGGGVVDSGYQGEILVKIINPNNGTILIERGKPIAQLLIQPVKILDIEEVLLSDITEKKTARGITGGIVNQVVVDRWDEDRFIEVTDVEKEEENYLGTDRPLDGF